jgi:hypothetical protein
MADLLGVAPVTVRRRVSDLSSKLLAATAVPPDRDKLRAWTQAHFNCCTLGVRQLIDFDQKLA